MSLQRRAFVACLFVSAGALAKSINSRGSRGAAPPPASGTGDVPGPAGVLSFTANWAAETGADGYLVKYDTVTRATGDRGYAYQKYFSGQSTATGAVGSLASGTYYWAVANVEAGVVGDVGQEFDGVAAA
jgi:hypothetical protein